MSKRYYTIDELFERVKIEPNDFYPEEPTILTADEPADRPEGGPRLLILTDEPAQVGRFLSSPGRQSNDVRAFFERNRRTARELYYRLQSSACHPERRRSREPKDLDPRSTINWFPFLVILACVGFIALWPWIWDAIAWVVAR